MSRKTFVGRVLGVTGSNVVMSTIDPAGGDTLTIQAGEAVLRQAHGLLGRVVRYTAEVASDTRCLSKPQFTVGSEFGLQAVSFRAPESAADDWTATPLNCEYPVR